MLILYFDTINAALSLLIPIKFTIIIFVVLACLLMFHTCDTNASQYLVQGLRSLLGLNDSSGPDVGDLFFFRVCLFFIWQVQPAVMTLPCCDFIQIPEWEKAGNFQALDIRDPRKSGLL